MTKERDDALEMFCTALEMKEKMRTLYEDAIKTCPDQVGIDTFRMLRDGEVDGIKSVQALYESLREGKDWVNSCKYHEIGEDKKDILHRIAQQHHNMPKACLDDVLAIETGLQLENVAIDFFSKCLNVAGDPVEREFLERMITDEREHYILLADLKFYYTDPNAWYMEKSRARLDGGG